MNDKKLRILEIGTMDIKGGAAQVSWLLKQKLEKQGHNVSMVVGYKKSQDKNVYEVFNTPLNIFVSKIIKRNFYERLTYHISYRLANDIYIPLAKKVRQLPIYSSSDIVHAHNLHSNFFNLSELIQISREKPFVWTLHDMWAFTGHNSYSFDCEHWQSGGCSCNMPDSIPPHKWNNTRYLWQKKKEIYEKSRLNLAVPSMWLYKLVQESMLKNQPLTLIYNGIDTDVYYPRNKLVVREKLGLPQDKKIIIFSSKAGKKFARKGWEYTKKIIERYKTDDSMLFLCVGGTAEENAQKNIRSISYISDPNALAEYYAASDLLIFTSTAENCPLTVLEAMASGLPVLAFATGGIPELTEHKINGYIAEYCNQEDLLAGFQWLINLSPNDYQKISSDCRQKAMEKFSAKQMAKNYLNLYNKLLAE